MRTESSPALGGRLAVTALTRRVGAFHLGLVGVVQVGVGLVLAYGGVTGRILQTTIAELGFVFDGIGAIEHGPLLAFAATRLAPALGVILVGLGVLAFVGAQRAAAGTEYRLAVAGGLGGLLDPLTAPLALIALALLWLCRVQFDDAARESESPAEPAAGGRRG